MQADARAPRMLDWACVADQASAVSAASKWPRLAVAGCLPDVCDDEMGFAIVPVALCHARPSTLRPFERPVSGRLSRA